ncbi:MAG: hypothetical protein WC541_05030 [Dehalococcoidia bacterium]
MKITLIEWLDTHCEDVWGPAGAACEMEPLRVVSVGIVLAEDSDKIVLTSMRSGETVSMVQCIPACCIVNRREL